MVAVLGAVGAVSDRGEEAAAGGEPGYVLAVCEGAACVPAVPVPDAPLGVAVGWLADRASRFRAKGMLGSVALLDARTGAVVARRRVWP